MDTHKMVPRASRDEVWTLHIHRSINPPYRSSTSYLTFVMVST